MRRLKIVAFHVKEQRYFKVASLTGIDTRYPHVGERVYVGRKKAGILYHKLSDCKLVADAIEYVNVNGDGDNLSL